MKRRRILAHGLAIGGFAAAPVLAQGDYPTRPVRLVIGFAAGGGADITARVLARRMSELLGQPVVIENKPGAGGNLATDLVAKATPDGYTILLSNVGSLAVAPHLNKSLPYDPARDLAPLSLAVTFSNIFVVHPAFKATTLAEYIALARAAPGTIGYGTPGVGSAAHLAGELLNRRASIQLLHVAYRGGAPAMNDALAGQLHSYIGATPTVLPQIAGGRLRALGVTGPSRSAALPDVPTVAEQGFPGYEVMNWYAFVAPARTPRAIVERLNAAIVAALREAEIGAQIGMHGMEAVPSTPEQLGRYMASESETWGRVIREAGITAD